MWHGLPLLLPELYQGTHPSLPYVMPSLLLWQKVQSQGCWWGEGAVHGLEHQGSGNRPLTTRPRKAGRRWGIGPRVSHSSKPQADVSLSHLIFHARHRFKDKIIKHFKMATTECKLFPSEVLCDCTGEIFMLPALHSNKVMETIF